MDVRDDRLIFIISLPRSGSTLLQHVLGSHSQVAATAEPWILFPGAYALPPHPLNGDYGSLASQTGLKEFLQQLDDGEEEYYAALRKMALHLYQGFLDKSGKQYFLDKTSRYYLILPEMARIFPRAKYIFLLRNPLAVLASFLETMVRQNWLRLGEPAIRNDLLRGYALLRQGILYFGDQAVVVRYEDFVRDPESATRNICDAIGIPFEPEMLQYGRAGVLPGRLVDPKSIHKHQEPVTDYADAWRSKFKTRHERELARGFLKHLGEDLITSLGYSYADLAAAVAEEGAGPRPLFARWDTLTQAPEERGSLLTVAATAELRWQQRGPASALRYLATRPLGFATRPARAGRRLLSRTRKRAARRLHGQGPYSADYQLMEHSELSPELTRGWQAASVAENQYRAYQPLLQRMREGKPRQDFVTAAEALRLTRLHSPTILEVGCGNGYYSEVLSHLSKVNFNYTGLDYSPAMIASARSHYPQWRFVVGDATELPFADGAFDIVWSGTVLMHLVGYERAIEETSRVARRFCIFHSTPVITGRDTTFLSKKAYGTPVAEVILNQAELEALLRQQGLKIRHILESLPYRVGNQVNGSVNTLTYICEKQGA